MTSFTFRVPPTLIDQAKDKAGLVNLSVIIRILLEKWIEGEIVIDQTK